MVRDRIDLLLRNGFQGIVLVFIVLALFLNLRLAFWVSVGIPISFMGAFMVLDYNGETINMISLFAFIMTLGILVDDAIIVGENISTHYGRGKSSVLRRGGRYHRSRRAGGHGRDHHRGGLHAADVHRRHHG
jgi:HAE1 family hydrophobic/amphiphilic exporter-1